MFSIDSQSVDLIGCLCSLSAQLTLHIIHHQTALKSAKFPLDGSHISLNNPRETKAAFPFSLIHSLLYS